MKNILKTDHILAAFKEASATQLNACIGIAISTQIEGDTLHIQIEGRTAATLGFMVVPSNNSDLILIGSDVMDILHGVALSKGNSQQVFEELSMAWAKSKFISIERISYAVVDEEKVGSTTVTTKGLIEHFRLAFSDMQKSYNSIGLSEEPNENQIPDYTLMDMDLIKGKENDAT